MSDLKLSSWTVEKTSHGSHVIKIILTDPLFGSKMCRLTSVGWQAWTDNGSWQRLAEEVSSKLTAAVNDDKILSEIAAKTRLLICPDQIGAKA